MVSLSPILHRCLRIKAPTATLKLTLPATVNLLPEYRLLMLTKTFHETPHKNKEYRAMGIVMYKGLANCYFLINENGNHHLFPE